MKKLLTMLVVALLAGTALVPDVDAKGERFPFALVVRFAHPTTTDQVLDVVDDKKLETDVVSIMAERNMKRRLAQISANAGHKSTRP